MLIGRDGMSNLYDVLNVSPYDSKETIIASYKN